MAGRGKASRSRATAELSMRHPYHFSVAFAVGVAAVLLVDASEWPRLRCAAWFLLVCCVIALGLWGRAVVYFNSKATAPRRTCSGPDQSDRQRVRLEWSVPNEFPEGFVPMLELSKLNVTAGEGVTGALVQSFKASGSAVLAAGTHPLRVSSACALYLSVPEGPEASRKCSIYAEAGCAAPDCESALTRVVLELPRAQVSGIAKALGALWELWDSESSIYTTLGAQARGIIVHVLQILELLFAIRLSAVEGTASGDQFYLFFSGTIWVIPFERILLPSFVVPNLHAPLSRLLSAHPVAGRSLRKSAVPPVPHPGLLATWNLDLSATFLAAGVDVKFRQQDGSIDSLSVSMEDHELPLTLQCEVSGSLGDNKLEVEMTSASLSSSAGSSISCNANASFTRSAKTAANSMPLPDVLYEAACQQDTKSIEGEFYTRIFFEPESVIPGACRLVYKEEHPLLTGDVNALVLVTRAAVSGECGMAAELPLLKKRDLLELPHVDLNIDMVLEGEDDQCNADDGFLKVSAHTAQGKASMHVWSCRESLQSEVSVEGSIRMAAEHRNSQLVKALEEAERAVRHAGDLQDSEEEAAIEYCIKAGDVVKFGAVASAKGSFVLKIEREKQGEDGQRPPASPASAPFVLNVTDASKGVLELRDAHASVGELAVELPKYVQVCLQFNELFINAEGIGRTHLQASWDGLKGQLAIHHAAKQMRAVLPSLPSSGKGTMRIGEMGNVTLSLDDEIDLADCANKLLDDETINGPLLDIADMLGLKTVAKKVLNFAAVVRNVVRTEHIDEPRDAIPADRLARLMARIMLEIGTNGKATADTEPSRLELEVLEQVRQVIDARGLDVTKITRLLWDNLPLEASTLVRDHAGEVDFFLRLVDSLLRPTEPCMGKDMNLAYERPPSHKYRRELEAVAPCATRFYEILRQPDALGQSSEKLLSRAAPYLTQKQVVCALRCPGLSDELRQRLDFILGVKIRAEKVAAGYGGPAFMPQGHAVGFFLAAAMRGGLVGEGGLMRLASEMEALGGGRLAAALAEQRQVVSELLRLQKRQQNLVEEVAELLKLPQEPAAASKPRALSHGVFQRSISDFDGVESPAGDDGASPRPPRRDIDVVNPLPPPKLPRSMLECLAPNGASTDINDAMKALRANTDLAAVQAQVERRKNRLYKNRGGIRGNDSNASLSSTTDSFSLGSSLLGPAEVAVLLQSGLAAVPQGQRVQQNQRMLLEICVSQPPLFMKGVLYELSSNGSSRLLGNNLMALLNLPQDALQPHARLDMADLLTQALGIQMPRRADFMAGGSRASQSYILFVLRAAKQVLEECEPYIALKYWLQRAEVQLPQIRPEPMPKAKQALENASRAIEEADRIGRTWLDARGAVWPRREPPAGAAELRARSIQEYRKAFALCAEIFQAHQEVLHADWFRNFWARNYDALTVVSALRNMQQDVDKTRHWLDAQLRFAEKGPGFLGSSQAPDDLWNTDEASENCLIDCLIEALFFEQADRDRYRQDALIQLLIEEKSGHYDFTVISAMGVITEGAAGTEMADSFARLLEKRGVQVIRADTGTLKTVDHNAQCVERAVQEHVRTPWGWLGYSQGCANAFRAEALMLQGTPQQRALMDGFRCRHLLFSAANGSAHATCSEIKINQVLVDSERFLKRFQASMSAGTQQLGLQLLTNLSSSSGAFSAFGSMQSLTHEGARKMWRDDQHCVRAPTTSMRGVIEKHTLPEVLQMLSNTLAKQMDYSKQHDTQVSVGEAVAHPIMVQNANAELLSKIDIQSAVHRTHHWSPLNAEVDFITTRADGPLAMFDTPKDRHIFPWIEVSARFGVIRRTESGAPRTDRGKS